MKNFRLSFRPVMLILITILTFCIAINFSRYGQNTLLDFLTEFSAGALGVLLAFTLEDAIQEAKAKRDSKSLRQDIREELKEIQINLLEKQELFPSDIWDSTISSGQIRLLKSEQIRKLTSIYRDFRRFEYDSKRIKELDEKIRLASAEIQRDWVQRLQFEKSPIAARNEERKKILIQKIEEVLKEEWLTPD